MERRMLVSLRGTVTLYTTSSQGSLNLMDKSSSSFFISHLVAIELHIPASCVSQHHLQLYRNLSKKHLLSLLILNQTLLLIIFKL